MGQEQTRGSCKEKAGGQCTGKPEQTRDVSFETKCQGMDPALPDRFGAISFPI